MSLQLRKPLVLTTSQALALADAGDLETALAVSQCIATQAQLSPDDRAAAWSNLGAIYDRANCEREAVKCYRHALSLRPQSAEALNNLGAIYLRRRDVWKAEPLIDMGLALEPTAALCNSKAACVLFRGADAEGLPWLEAGERMGDRYKAELQWNKCMALLGMGKWEEGWKHYQWRERLRVAKRHKPLPQKPRWEGEPLEGRKLLLLADQAYGDAIMWARYIPRIGAPVIVETHAPMRDLFENMPEVERTTLLNEDLPECDCWTYLTSLPQIFNARPHASAGYLKPSKHVSVHGKDFAKLKIGLFWQGRIDPASNFLRSANDDFAKEIQQRYPQVAWVSLQHDKEPLPGMIDVRKHIQSLGNVANLMCALDGICTIDSYPAHLAGALGLETLVLLHYAPEWRWKNDVAEGRSKWYPRTKLVQQTAWHDWDSVIPSIGDWLEHLGRR